MAKQEGKYESTQVIRVQDVLKDKKKIAKAAQVLKAGELVAFPTETVYGVGALALHVSTVAELYRAKERPPQKPFSVQIAHIGMLDQVADNVPLAARKLMKAFCPGPLTVIVPKNPQLPNELTAGRNTVGVRIPDHPIALALLEAVGEPLAVPSANISGHSSPRTAAEVLDDMAGRIPLLIDGGECLLGRASTIVDCSGRIVKVLRQGALPVRKLVEVLDEKVLVMT